MSEKTKRILLIVGFIAVVFLIAWGLWALFFRSAPSPTLPPTAEPTLPGRVGLAPAPEGRPGIPIAPPSAEERAGLLAPLPSPVREARPLVAPTASGGLTKLTTLTEDPVIAPTRAAGTNDVAFYNQGDGKFYRVTNTGTITPLSDRVFKNVERVAWAPNAAQAILEFPDGANILYRFAVDKQVTLPKHWEGFGFETNGQRIAFKSVGLDPEDRWLAVGDPDGSNAVPIEPLGVNGDRVTVNWSPNQQMVATFTKSRDGTRQELYFIGKNKENFRLAVLEGRQFTGQWMPEGDRMLYSVYSPATDLKPSLWIVDAGPETSGENRQALNVQTWADKCTTAPDNRMIYCAVPRDLPRGAGMVREIARTTVDDFYRIDTETGAKALIAIPAGEDVTASNLVLAENQQTLFFQNTRTGLLQKIDLK